MLGDSHFTVQAGTPMTVTGKGTLPCVLGQGVDPLSFTFCCLKISRGPGQGPGAFNKCEQVA